LAAAEAGINTGGSTSYVMSVQQVFGWVGLGAALSRDLTARQLIVLAPGEASFRNEAVRELPGRVDSVLGDITRENMRLIAPAVQDPDALMERVSLDAANELLLALMQAMGSSSALPAWLPAPQRRDELNGSRYRISLSQEGQRIAAVAAALDPLAESYAVPGHEGSVRNMIYNALPDWARQLAQVDDMGNLWVEFGPVSQAAVFVAHMDEVGFEVESIASDGVVSLRRLGGAVSTAWEGQPAVLELDSGTDIDSDPDAPLLRGVFLTRSEAEQKQADAVRAWFGLNSEQLAAAGVVNGMGVTIYKEGHRMGPNRYAARSMDDRVGSTALLLALQELNPQQLDHRVIFAWSVREEGGLRGAARLASQYGTLSRRVYSIDTFVTSDTPLESPHFAYAPLGRGPVLRSIENASMATPYELDRNRRIATGSGVPFQIGLTQGGTDGTTFTPYGAPNAGLSWPGRYSHSPAEIADLRDIAGLVELIKAMALAPLD
ncbi:MAG: M28 family peptidase, partial [Gammaproteobacteria bacterium]